MVLNGGVLNSGNSNGGILCDIGTGDVEPAEFCLLLSFCSSLVWHFLCPCPAETYTHLIDTEDKIDASNEQLHDQSLATVPSPFLMIYLLSCSHNEAINYEIVRTETVNEN